MSKIKIKERKKSARQNEAANIIKQFDIVAAFHIRIFSRDSFDRQLLEFFFFILCVSARFGTLLANKPYTYPDRKESHLTPSACDDRFKLDFHCVLL